MVVSKTAPSACTEYTPSYVPYVASTEPLIVNVFPIGKLLSTLPAIVISSGTAPGDPPIKGLLKNVAAIIVDGEPSTPNKYILGEPPGSVIKIELA